MIERERKFIVETNPFPYHFFDTISQGYLIISKDDSLRVRLYQDKAYLCYKKNISHTDRYEYEYIIDYKDGLELFGLCDYCLYKNRYDYEIEGYNISVDMYLEDLDSFGNRVIAEIEYKSEPITLPDYFGREVTGDDFYSNINFAKRTTKT